MIPSLPRGRCKCPLGSPSPFIKATVNDMRTDLETLTQVRDTPCHALNCVNPIRAPVSRLLTGGLPFAIGWRIGSVVVLSANAHSGRRLAHVREKVQENIPSLAYSDSSSPIIRKVGVIGIGASIPHSKPSTVNTSNSTMHAMAMLGVSMPLAHATRSSVPGSRVPERDSRFSSANATAQNHPSVFAASRDTIRKLSDNFKLSKGEPNSRYSWSGHSMVTSCLCFQQWHPAPSGSTAILPNPFLNSTL